MTENSPSSPCAACGGPIGGTDALAPETACWVEIRTFTVPLLPTSKNVWSRAHWSKRRTWKRAWTEEVFAAVNARPRLPRPANRVSASAEVGWDKRGPLPDFHNLEMLHEVVADALTEKLGCGIITDDAEGRYRAGQIVTVRGDGTTTVRLVACYRREGTE